MRTPVLPGFSAPPGLLRPPPATAARAATPAPPHCPAAPECLLGAPPLPRLAASRGPQGGAGPGAAARTGAGAGAVALTNCDSESQCPGTDVTRSAQPQRRTQPARFHPRTRSDLARDNCVFLAAPRRGTVRLLRPLPVCVFVRQDSIAALALPQEAARRYEHPITAGTSHSQPRVGKYARLVEQGRRASGTFDVGCIYCTGIWCGPGCSWARQ